MNKMKKISSMLLALILCCSTSLTAFAEEKTTIVTYTAPGIEQYEVTVPATLEPNSTTTIDIEGTWASNRELVITTPETVTMVSNITGNEEVLDVTVSDADKNVVVVGGSNRAEITSSAKLSVSSMPSDILFGTYTGTITYNISIEDSLTDIRTLEPGIYNTNLEKVAEWSYVSDGSYVKTDKLREFDNSIVITGDEHTSFTSLAFCAQEKVKVIVVNKNVTQMNYSAFESCTNLETVIFLNENLADTGFQENMFKGCTKLSTVELPNKLTKLFYGFFDGCTSLKTITIPDSVTTIDSTAFTGCTSLSSITWKGTTYTDKAAFNQAIKNAGIATEDVWK